MKILLLFEMFLLVALNCGSQESETIDTTDVRNVTTFPAAIMAEGTPDTISIESIMKPSIVQMSLGSSDDKYGVEMESGIYGILKWENMKNKEYKKIWFSLRREIEGKYYTYFGWIEEDSKGVFGVADSNNQHVTIWSPEKDQERKEDEP